MTIILICVATLVLTHFAAIWKAKDDSLVITTGYKVNHLFWGLVRMIMTMFWAACWYWAFKEPYSGFFMLCALSTSYWWITFDFKINWYLGKDYDFIGTTAWDDVLFLGNWNAQFAAKFTFLALSVAAIIIYS